MSHYDGTVSLLELKPSSIYGLRFIPQLMSGYNNDQDGPILGSGSARTEISTANRIVAQSTLRKLGNNCKAIVEIGVHRNSTDSLTHIFITQKPKDCRYLGIDIDDKSSLNDKSNNVFTLQANSHNQQLVRSTLSSLGMNKIDLLVIDGLHSVNTCINDWLYADLLSDYGAVIMHDTNFHPGPIALFYSIDENLFKKDRYCVSADDNGIAVAWHLK